MGSLAFDDMKDYVKLRCGQRTDLEEIGSDDVNYYGIWVNQAYKQICSSERLFGLRYPVYHPQLETSTTTTTTDGTAYVSVPSGALIVRQIDDTDDDVTLDWISWKTYLEYTDRSDTTAEASPREWTRGGSNLYLHPTPDSTINLEIWYKKVPTSLSGTSTTSIGSEWDEPIVALATLKAHQYLGEWDKVKLIQDEFISNVSGILMTIHQEEKGRKDNIHPDEGYWRT